MPINYKNGKKKAAPYKGVKRTKKQPAKAAKTKK